MAVASQSALPGDPLYPLKRAIENAQTGVQSDEDAKGKALLDNASGRLEEVDQLSREGNDADAISETLQTFSDQASEASELLLSDFAETGQEDSVEELRAFTADSMTTLTALEAVVPEGARPSLIKAAQTLAQIDEQALIACPSCGPDAITQIPPFTNVALDELLNGSFTQAANTSQQPQDPSGPAANKPPRETGQQPLTPGRAAPLDRATSSRTASRSPGTTAATRQRRQQRRRAGHERSPTSCCPRTSRATGPSRTSPTASPGCSAACWAADLALPPGLSGRPTAASSAARRASAGSSRAPGR